MVRVIVDRPVVVTVLLACLSALHALGAQLGDLPTPWGGLIASGVGDVQVPVYLGLASVGAVTAGFAGVVVVFILQANTPAFRKLRLQARGSITANAISIVASSIAVALIGLGCSLLASLGYAWLAVWVFEFGALVLVHALVRALLLFKAMIGVVIVDDDSAAKAARQQEIADELSRRRGSRHAG